LPFGVAETRASSPFQVHPISTVGVSMRIAISSLPTDSSTSPRDREGAHRDPSHKGDRGIDVGPAVTVTLSESALAQARALEEEESEAPVEARVPAKDDDRLARAPSARASPAPAPPAGAPPADGGARRPKALFPFAKTGTPAESNGRRRRRSADPV
jgi:hypothetical protein